MDTDKTYLYTNKDGRQRLVYRNNEGNITSISYPKYLMQNYLKRELLPNEQVHHKDHNPLNNNIDNLEVISFEDHLKLHAEENRKYEWTLEICMICGKPFSMSPVQWRRFYQDKKRGRDRFLLCSKECMGKASSKLYPFLYDINLRLEKVKLLWENRK